MAVDDKQRYPQSTPDGEAIPFEIIRPLGLILVAFSSVASANITIPAGAGFLVLRADADCLIQLDGVVAVPADGVHIVGLVALNAGEILVLDHNGAATLSVIRYGTTNGVLKVQTITKYADIRKSAQLERL